MTHSFTTNRSKKISKEEKNETYENGSTTY